MSDKKIEQQDVQEAAPINITEQIKALVDQLANTREYVEYIKPDSLPDIDLYMDQVTTFMETRLQMTKRYEDDKILTKTMINNYAKNNLLPPPDKKKYSKDHILLMTLIYYLKSMLSMNDIQCIMKPFREDFFQKDDSELNLSVIYQSVFSQIENTRPGLVDDILHKYDVSRNLYEDHPELQEMVFVWMLCYDVFIKKQLVEKIIDKIALVQEQEAAEKEKKKK